MSVMVNECDLTVIFLTLNKLSDSWVQFHRQHLLHACDGYKIISISSVPIDIGTNILQTDPPSDWNVYRQLLRGARLADTLYVAVAEDDTLYTPEHFRDYRPSEHAVSYDMSRWSLCTWSSVPTYYTLNRMGNFTLIASRLYLIDALEERERKYPNGHIYAGEVGRNDVERRLGVSYRKAEVWSCRNPIVNVSHQLGLHPRYRGTRRKMGAIQAYDIPYWGKAGEIVRIFNG